MYRSGLKGIGLSLAAGLALAAGLGGCGEQQNETGKAAVKAENAKVEAVVAAEEAVKKQADRMDWWREARFGMFIHWGLYAVPAGQWGNSTNHAEWILTTAQIPVDRYEKFAPEFNPVKFSAKDWVRMAKEAGMKYIVITSKHHDGFCLFDSKLTDYDIMDATPFKRDVLKELAEECSKQGIKMCFYHSIMDWHHPDYLPRRGWEKRSAEGADFERYVKYMKGQLKELMTNYGDIGVIWFDGEWERTWTHDRGVDLYNYMRSLSPTVLVNNRVDKGRGGMAGTHDTSKYMGDFGTPEQEIPATGLGDYDWESCMTMNNHWGYNKHDNNWKSTEDLLRKLADIASKGGNFLLNIGPKADGTFPQASIDRLSQMGQWMDVNGESIYGTTASPFKYLPWGRCTRKSGKLYLHVFDWPQDGKLFVPGLTSKVKKAYLLAGGKKLSTDSQAGGVVVNVPATAPDKINSVVVLEIAGEVEVINNPQISASDSKFLDNLEVKIASDAKNAKVRYTLNGTDPTASSKVYAGPLTITETTEVKCQVYRGSKAISGVSKARYVRVVPQPGVTDVKVAHGIKAAYYKGDWSKMPDFSAIKPDAEYVAKELGLDGAKAKEYYAIKFDGYVMLPVNGMYTFYISSDDGSKLYVGDKAIVDNDGLHASREKSGTVALSAGLHKIGVQFFQASGGSELKVSISGPGIEKTRLPGSLLFHEKSE